MAPIMRRLPTSTSWPAMLALMPWPGTAWKACDLPQFQPALRGGRHDGLGERMLAALLGGGRQAQHVGFTQAAAAEHNIRHRRAGRG